MVCAKTITGQEAYFKQNDPHPHPPVRREREQPDPSLAASKAVGYADERQFSLCHSMGERAGVRVTVPSNPKLFVHESKPPLGSNGYKRLHSASQVNSKPGDGTNFIA